MPAEKDYIASTFYLGGKKDTKGIKSLHGGKGAGLIDMAAGGLPVPEALILTTDCWEYYQNHKTLPSQVYTQIEYMLEHFPTSMFSVRSGAPVSMPGMMDTVLNVGVDDMLDDLYPGAFRRFATSWLSIVKAVPKDKIKTLEQTINDRVHFSDMEADPKHNNARARKLLRGIVQASEKVVIPDTRVEQIFECAKAVFRSWNTPRAIAYRKMHNIPDHMGTACVIQRMVMGTAPGLSGSGVMFSRDPATGENKMKGEFAFNAQGEEVVSGEVTPQSLDDLYMAGGAQTELHTKLMKLCTQLEGQLGDVQDIEFTVEDGSLYVLQTRTAKMSARARIETACDLAQNLHVGDRKKQLEYLKARITRSMVMQTMTPTVTGADAPAATGLAASPGAISGKVVFANTPLDQITKDCILVAEDTTPDDFPVMAKCGGILTKTGGFTCHSAVVARGIGVPAVVGCDALKFNGKGHGTPFTIPGVGLFSKGDWITIDGATGSVYPGQHEVIKSQPPRCIYSLLHSIVQDHGTKLPPNVYYYDCGIGDNVVLPINPFEADTLDRQLARASRLSDKGKAVAFAMELQGMGEDMFDPKPEAIFQELAEHYGPDLKGKHILYGVPNHMADAVKTILGMTCNTSVSVQIIDLLDLLGGNE